jgi:hypothetical protein
VRRIFLLLICFLFINCGDDAPQRDIVDIRISKDKLDLSAYTECIYPVNAIDYNITNFQQQRIFCEYDDQSLTLQESVYTDEEPSNSIKSKKTFSWHTHKVIISYYDYGTGESIYNYLITTITIQF